MPLLHVLQSMADSDSKKTKQDSDLAADVALPSLPDYIVYDKNNNTNDKTNTSVYIQCTT